ncbi:MAG: TrbI/VirB10 family protein, partial [Rhodospirillaceae bacterium]|nr:TrbI/VirB10 family protein [Rhodospirillaceae bacterium]
QSQDRLGAITGLGIALALGVATFWTLSQRREQVPPITANVADAEPVIVQPVAPPAPVASVMKPQLPVPVAIAPDRDRMYDRAKSPVLVLDTLAMPQTPVASPTATSTGVTPTDTPGQPADGTLSSDEAFAQRMGRAGANTVMATATFNPATTVAQGTMIAAILETAIDTDLPGYVRAMVTEDITSFDGAKVLIPRTSRLIGQYKSGLAAGQTRAYVLWTRLIRPDGVSVALASPAVGFDGQTGLSGRVDSHFMDRFGSAILLSVVGAASAVGNATVVLSGSQSAAAVAAQRDAQIPPTVRVPLGQHIRVFTSRDLDFASVEPAKGAS